MKRFKQFFTKLWQETQEWTFASESPTITNARMVLVGLCLLLGAVLLTTFLILPILLLGDALVLLLIAPH